MPDKQKITIHAVIAAPVETVWKLYNQPEHVVRWNNASADWHTPKAENDLRVGGRFVYRMEAKDGSAGFDFSGVYGEVEANTLIKYQMDDRREVLVLFEPQDASTAMTVTFDAEEINPIEMQRNGWQSILDNFKKYVESQK